MKVSVTQKKAIAKEIKDFDGGVWELEGRKFVVIATHGWGMGKPGEWKVAVAFQPLEQAEDEPNTYVMDRAEFLSVFSRVG